MSLVDKYITENKIEEASKMYKSFTDRINRAKSAKDITKVLGDIKKALKTKDLEQKEAINLADMADDRLEEI